MPKLNQGSIQYVEVDFNNQDFTKIHRGPNNQSKSVLEVKTVDRIYTLYTDDEDVCAKFVTYLNKMIEMRDAILNIKNAHH